MKTEDEVPPEGGEAPEQQEQKPDQGPANSYPWFTQAVAGGVAGAILAVHGVTPQSLPDALPANVEAIAKYGRLDWGDHGDPNAPREHFESTANVSSGPMLAAAWGHPLEPYSVRVRDSLIWSPGSTNTSSFQELNNLVGLFARPTKDR